MLVFMTDLVMLSALFALIAGIALLFRRTVLRNRESTMYYAWFFILLMAVVPLRLGEPVLYLFPQTEKTAQYSAGHNSLKLSELLKEQNLLQNALSETETRPSPEIKAQGNQAEQESRTEAPKKSINIFKAISENRDLIAFTAFVIWLTGVIFLASGCIFNWFRMKKMLTKESTPCEDERLNHIFSECVEDMRVRRRIELRILRWDFTSPCVCGAASPVIFLSPSCLRLCDEKLRYIFVHELCHVKRADIIYKIFSLAVTFLHWFNPLAYKTVRTLNEDCELATDRYVMNRFGSDKSGYYMSIILDMAQQRCDGIGVKNKMLSSALYMSLFFGESSNKNFLKRRYTNMKTNVNMKRLVIILALFLAAVTAINTAVMSSCGIIPQNGESGVNTQPRRDIPYPDEDVYEAALRLYFGLTPDENPTEEQLAEITDIKILKGAFINENLYRDSFSVGGTLTPVSFIINGRNIGLLPAVVGRKAFEQTIIRKVVETYVTDETVKADYLNRIDNSIYMDVETYVNDAVSGEPVPATVKGLFGPEDSINSREYMKLMAYYRYNPDDVYKELVERYAPDGFYVFDPLASEREYGEILGYLSALGAVDDNFISGDTLDVGYLEVFPNLESVSFTGIKYDADKLPEGLNVTAEEFTVTPTEAAEPAPEPVDQTSSGYPVSKYSGQYNPPLFGIHSDDKGEYVILKNDSLKSALYEYFGLYGGPAVADTRITPDMLAAITSLKIRHIPEYDYIFEDMHASMPQYEGIPEKYRYTEYTINGETLGITPEFLRAEAEYAYGAAPEKLTELYDKIEGEGDYYYYQRKEGLTDEQMLEALKITGQYDLNKIAIYQDMDNSYFTVFESPSSYFTGLPARFEDKAEYDQADLEYMTNLSEFAYE